MMRKGDKTRPDTGTVWLVGAGPGDPGLLTIKGRDCIATADVVFYDALVHNDLLAYARSECERKFVGKKAGAHAFTQARINAMLAERARAGKKVCRLKGGDPFVFGRGGEEALYLRRRGIPVIIVPGVSAVIAVPAYAGIPVTHRGCADSLRVVTGHEMLAADGRGYWREASSERGTLVVLMGLNNLAEITARLIKHGMPGERPAALISNGTLPGQHVVAAPLGVIAQCARQARMETPATLIIGETVRLQNALAWFQASASATPAKAAEEYCG
ncbi:MAG TPA: uroporphyrinogen-III C-methyltransferase [Candidatus Hydrogenedentes bacterium]|nr:uroporphyrinogen-III C-methyltransferase [Candidatus Hydrogenedentota bacterium]